MGKTSMQPSNKQDLTSDVIQALSALDVEDLSYVQLRKLGVALNNASNDVSIEAAKRTGNDNSGDTVRVTSPRFEPPR